MSALRRIVILASKLPWWLGAAFAVIGYFVFHYFATLDRGLLFAFGATLESSVQHVARISSQVMQYLVPLVFGSIAIVSFLNRAKSQRAVKVRTTLPKRTLGQMTWQEFELATAEAFRGQGYAVELQGGGAPDGGIDLVLERDDERYLVQCKHWRANRVGVPIIRELYGIMAAEGIASGFVVTSGSFTRQARRFAAGREIELIDGNRLTAMLRPSMQTAATVSP